MSYYTNSKNPYTNLIDRPYVLWSASQGGASSSAYRLGTTDVTIPASPNYPPSESGASTSYFIFTKWDFYKTSTNSTQFYLYNETQSKVITVVDQDAILSNYTGKFMGQGSEKRNVIECHVGTTSNQAGDQISYKSVVTGSVFDAYEINNFEVDTLTVNTSYLNFLSTSGIVFNSTLSSMVFNSSNISFTASSVVFDIDHMSGIDMITSSQITAGITIGTTYKSCYEPFSAQKMNFFSISNWAWNISSATGTTYKQIDLGGIQTTGGSSNSTIGQLFLNSIASCLICLRNDLYNEKIFIPTSNFRLYSTFSTAFDAIKIYADAFMEFQSTLYSYSTIYRGTVFISMISS